MKKDKLDTRILKLYFENATTEEENKYVLRVFSDKEYEEELIQYLKSQWYGISNSQNVHEKDLNHILQKLQTDIQNEGSGMSQTRFTVAVKWFSRIAAVLFIPLLIFSGIHFFNNTERQVTPEIEIVSPAWTKVKFALPDGTTGWLNSNSSIKYYSSYLQKREIELKGEAFFDVRKVESKPFSVLADEIQLQVTGTRFNVASFENEENVEVVLESGSLLLNSLDKSRSFKMIPNDLITYDKKSRDFTRNVVQPANYTSWTEGKLVFRNDPIDVVARRLERWYNVNVVVKGNFSHDLRLRATFRDEKIEQVLYWIGRSLPIEYRIREEEIVNNSFTKRQVEITIK